ncbi:type II toxin-antitoxin system HicB family antitoxin [Natronomonas sp. EA1]|uniref:type II toxin-antitoxin system HicB family antitoxin n=1 Tax=Natronomonas sp. EA1 TaxID=3421655 RepID=UPI003EB7DC83
MESNARRPGDQSSVTVVVSDGYFVATDEETGVTSQGETKPEALSNLAEALELYWEADDAEPEESNAPWL